MSVKFLAEGNNGGPLLGLELTTDWHPPITSQKRYPLRHAANLSFEYNTQQTGMIIFLLVFPWYIHVHPVAKALGRN